MNLIIRKYDSHQDYEPLMALIRSEGSEWKDYLQPNYQTALNNSITYVAVWNDEICGYSRSLTDSGLFIWVIDLLIHKSKRGHEIGKQLMECLTIDFPGVDVYVMSDVDRYYEKLGYSKEGSIFKVMP